MRQDVNLSADHAVLVQVNNLANGASKLAYQKALENKISLLKISVENGLITKERAEEMQSKLWADCFRTE